MKGEQIAPVGKGQEDEQKKRERQQDAQVAALTSGLRETFADRLSFNPQGDGEGGTEDHKHNQPSSGRTVEKAWQVAKAPAGKQQQQA